MIPRANRPSAVKTVSLRSGIKTTAEGDNASFGATR
jgi:hypothetical protein